MSKKKIQNKNTSIILNTLKIESPYVCPKCDERHYAYISKNGKQKGIEFGEYYYEGLFKDHYRSNYYCHTCGYSWEKKNK